MLNPTTLTSSHSDDSSASFTSTKSSQAWNFFELQSSTVVPWPGKLGATALKPFFERYSARGNVSYVVLEKPCKINTPLFEPSFKS